MMRVAYLEVSRGVKNVGVRDLLGHERFTGLRLIVVFAKNKNVLIRVLKVLWA